MFRRIFAVLLALLMLCSCGAEEPEKPVVPEEPEIENPEEEKPDFDALRTFCTYPDDRLYSDIVFDEESAYAYRTTDPMQLEIPRTIYWASAFGEFDEREDIPDENIIEAAIRILPRVQVKEGFGGYYIEGVEELYSAAGNSEFVPKEWVEIFAEKLLGKPVEIEHKSLPELNIEYHEEAGVYTPAGTERGFRYPFITEIKYYEYGGGCYVKYFYITEGMQGFSLGDSGELLAPGDVPLWEDERVLEFAKSGKDVYSADLYERDGWSFYVRHIVKETQEPELIAEHIAMLNELEGETFGIEHRSWQEENYVRLYKEKPYGEGFERGTSPDALEPSSTFYGVSMGEGYQYNGYYVDLNCEGVYPATNFSSKLEVFENLCKWFAPEIIEKSSFEDHVMDFNGEVYLLRHSRGYGMSYYGDSEIVEQTETEMTVIAKIYRIVKSEAGTAEIKFEKNDGRWIIVSAENNYY